MIKFAIATCAILATLTLFGYTGVIASYIMFHNQQ